MTARDLRRSQRSPLGTLACCVLVVILGACGADFSSDEDEDYPRFSKNRRSGDASQPTDEKAGGIFGKDGLQILGGGGGGGGDGGGAGVGVNSWLWRASLDTIAFMPLSTADPFGGVIITDWYTPPETPAERFKVNIFILGRELRADGVRAAVFRQNRDNVGAWVDAPVEQQTATDLEDAILTRARQLRIASEPG